MLLWFLNYSSSLDLWHLELGTIVNIEERLKDSTVVTFL